MVKFFDVVDLYEIMFKFAKDYDFKRIEKKNILRFKHERVYM